MSTNLRDRARKAASKTPKKPEPPASTEPTDEAAPVSSTPEADLADADATKSTDTEGAEVVDLAAKVIETLTPEQINALIQAHEDEVEALSAEPFTATLRATRETKANQTQYDGKTPEGYVVRVWAPEGSEMLIGATLARAADIPLP